ncbi:mfsd1 [Symbiodinium natans]|uniref:Lysosomal dipeptide transporter MFSD1 n=1 Tax=Symbiodinium natans TaxID=878477 RepID=A0A812R6M0_9DINO|nr:mfsd1 [Symbiodinium natans]
MLQNGSMRGWALALLLVIAFLLPCSACCGRRVAKYFVDPRRGLHKYILLTLICLFIPGSYFHDGLVQSFKGPISDSMHLSNSQFASLFVVSSLTGVLCSPGSLLISRVGRTSSAIAASFMAAIGSSVTTVGYVWGSLALMLLGRLLFWFGLNVLLMVQTILTYDLYKGRNLNCAMTTIVLSIRLGGSMSYPMSGPLLRSLGVLDSLWFSVMLVVAAFFSTLLFGYLFQWTATARAVRPMLERHQTPSSIELGLVRKVPKLVFVFLSGIAAIWGVVFPFEVIGNDMLQKEFGYSADDAGFIIALAPMISICSPALAPFLGSRLTQKLVAFGTGMVFLALAFFVIAVLRWAVLGIVLVGMGYAVSVCASYSSLPLVIAAVAPAELQKKMESLAVGLNQVGSGTSMIVSNLTIGIIKDHTSYRWACVYLAAVSCCGLASAT